MASKYITRPQLAEKPGAVELAQVTAQPGTAPVPSEILDALLHGEDVSVYAPDDVAKGYAALARIDEVVDDAESVVDGYLRQRGYKMPFKRTPRVLTTWTRAIARYYLHQHLISNESTSPIVRDYRDALKFLQAVADGKFSLGIEDDQAQSAGKAYFIKHDRLFTAETLKDY